MLQEIIRWAEEAQRRSRKERIKELWGKAVMLAQKAQIRSRNLLRRKMARMYSEIEAERSRMLAALKASEKRIESIEGQIVPLKRREEALTAKIRQLLNRLKACREWAEFGEEIIAAVGREAEEAQPEGGKIDFVNGLKELDKALEARKAVRAELNGLYKARKEARREKAEIEDQLAALKRAREEVYAVALVDPEVERLWGRFLHFKKRANHLVRLARMEEPKEEKKEARGLRLNEVARVKFNEASLAAWEKAAKLGFVK